MTIRHRISGSTSNENGGVDIPKETAVKTAQIIPAIFDFYTAISLVFGGCCSNVLTYEQLLVINPRIGSALTFSQMLFIALRLLPSFLTFSESWLPQLKPRRVPLKLWTMQVLVLTTGSLLNNWAFAYKVPLTILIVIRSAGLPVSMLFGYLIAGKRYSPRQFVSVVFVFGGVIIATLSKTSSYSKSVTQDELHKYLLGIMMMIISLFCTGLLGLLQERTYKKYGPCWREAMFYTHSLSLPVFLFLRQDVKQGILSLSASSTRSPIKSFSILLANLVAQLTCVTGVAKLSSQVSSVSTNIALTARKALSLCLSVWWFKNNWNAQLGFGAFMVFFGSLLYAVNPEEKTNKIQ